MKSVKDVYCSTSYMTLSILDCRLCDSYTLLSSPPAFCTPLWAILQSVALFSNVSGIECFLSRVVTKDPSSGI